MSYDWYRSATSMNDPRTAAVPEPATLSLLAVALAGLGLARRRRGR